eukprot:5166354-Amphidinium_carterae.1
MPKNFRFAKANVKFAYILVRSKSNIGIAMHFVIEIVGLRLSSDTCCKDKKAEAIQQRRYSVHHGSNSVTLGHKVANMQKGPCDKK